MVINRFIFNDGAADNMGGNAADVQDNKDVNTGAENNGATNDEVKDTKDATAPIVEAPQLSDEIKAQLAELEELRAFKASTTGKAEKTPEQLAKEKEQDKAEFLKFSVDNDLLKLDDLTKYETVKVKADADLVFEGFATQFKEDNPDITDPELTEAAKAEFDAEYKLSSDNENSKKRGLAKLAKDAAEIRTPLENTYNKAQQSYTEAKGLKEKMPAFEKFIDSIIENKATDKVVIFNGKEGEEDITIDIELTKEDKEAIAKAFKTHKTFYQFDKNKPEDIEASLGKKIEGWIEVNKSKEIKAKIAETFKGIGVKQGSKVGADNPFALQQDAKRQAPVVDLEANTRANEARKKYATR